MKNLSILESQKLRYGPRRIYQCNDDNLYINTNFLPVFKQQEHRNMQTKRS